MQRDLGEGAVWDLKYEQGLPSLTIPDPFFITAYKTFAEGRFPSGRTALDVAGGLGRHALWLAARDWQVSVVDVSAVAMTTLRQEAERRNLKLDLFAIDAPEYDFKAKKYDLIVLFYYLNRTVFPRIVSALQPGGLLICKMATHWDFETAVPNAVNWQLQKNELVELLPELRVLDHRERPVRDRGVVEFVGAKPG
jgi:hypothetical protein